VAVAGADHVVTAAAADRVGAAAGIDDVRPGRADDDVGAVGADEVGVAQTESTTCGSKGIGSDSIGGGSWPAAPATGMPTARPARARAAAAVRRRLLKRDMG
jgi:hypothetical protein